MGTGPDDRAISPVVGTILMVVITILLASTLTFVVQFDTNDEMADDVVEGDLGTATPEGDGLQSDLVVAENTTPGASDVVHSTVIEVDEAAGVELDEITIDYPTEVDLETSQQEDVLSFGIDTDADGELEESFSANNMGINTNDGDSRLTITKTTEYTLSEGDRVVLRVDSADNPDSAGEYNVTVTLNSDQTEDGTLVVG
ncbi:archaellin/type IV pilin N-terminal domain-containing protein [Haloparvum sp. PAK95]|uniref:archaellin/type IV pilin N-terminal domain-containing protein n=1 Tax=Haloparvum sp. PAK95 TaxID=3418962 RepID=UPI003D2F4C35